MLENFRANMLKCTKKRKITWSGYFTGHGFNFCLQCGKARVANLKLLLSRKEKGCWEWNKNYQKMKFGCPNLYPRTITDDNIGMWHVTCACIVVYLHEYSSFSHHQWSLACRYTCMSPLYSDTARHYDNHSSNHFDTHHDLWRKHRQ